MSRSRAREPETTPTRRGRFFRLPSARPARLLIALLALVLVAAMAFRAWEHFQLRAVRAEAVRTFGSVDPRDYAMPAADPHDDVMARLAAVAGMLASDDDFVDADLVRRPAAQWSEDDRRQVRNLLVAHAAALVRARGVVGLSAVGPADTYGWLDGGPEATVPLIRVLKLLRLHAALAVYDGEPDLAAGSIAALGHLADAFYLQPNLGLQLVGGLGEQWQLSSLRELLAAAPRNEDELAGVTLCRHGNPEDLRRALGSTAADLFQHGIRDLWGRELEPLPRAYAYFLGDLWVARSARALLTAAEVGQVPFPELSRRLRESTRSSADVSIGSPPPLVETESALLHLRSVAAVRHQARLALAAARAADRTGSYPGTLPGLEEPVPVVLSASSYTRRPDGSAVVDHPALRQLLNEQAPHVADLVLWPLPAPSPPGAR